MKYLSVTFFISSNNEVKQSCRDVLTYLLGDAGFESFEDTGEGVVGYIQIDKFDQKATDAVISSFPIQDASIKYLTKKVEDTDWNKAWEHEGFEPITVADKVTVFDARHPLPQSTPPTAVMVGIKTEMAFGTGTHQTTRMMLEALTETNLHHQRILDCGCGTGILALVASKLGATEVTAYDIDEWSVKNTELNAENNDVKNIKVLLGDAAILKQISDTFDIIMANINRNILLADLPAFVSKATPGTKIYLSGFYISDVTLIEEKAATLHLRRYGMKTIDQWAMLMFESE
jgi:ribosomal protein L11 methyltransferase